MQPNSPATPEATERAYPYIVEMLVPEGGFGRKLDAMQQFHARHGIQPQGGRSRREAGRDYIRWCFADPGIAVEFADEFSGTIGHQHSD
jgi:hypothetical protein